MATGHVTQAERQAEASQDPRWRLQTHQQEHRPQRGRAFHRSDPNVLQSVATAEDTSDDLSIEARRGGAAARAINAGRRRSRHSSSTSLRTGDSSPAIVDFGTRRERSLKRPSRRNTRPWRSSSPHALLVTRWARSERLRFTDRSTRSLRNRSPRPRPSLRRNRSCRTARTEPRSRWSRSTARVAERPATILRKREGLPIRRVPPVSSSCALSFPRSAPVRFSGHGQSLSPSHAGESQTNAPFAGSP